MKPLYSGLANISITSIQSTTTTAIYKTHSGEYKSEELAEDKALCGALDQYLLIRGEEEERRGGGYQKLPLIKYLSIYLPKRISIANQLKYADIPTGGRLIG